MSKLGRNSFVTGTLTTSLLSLVVFANGCDKVKDVTGALCCKDFQVGADMSAVDWEIEDPAVEARFGSLVQGVGDFSGLAAATASDVSGACRAIALDLTDGAAANDPSVANEGTADGGAVDPGVSVKAWCALAVKAIGEAKAAAAVNANAQLTAVVQPPQCQAEASFQAKCDAKCNVNISAECKAELGDINARCEPGELSGSCEAECSGSCTGSASVEVSCTGTCSGQCSGECKAEGSASVECAGTCNGTCKGNCTVGANTTAVDGNCAGTCEGQCTGTCKLNAGAKVNCQGSCTGKCDATCTPPQASAKVKCEGSCKGSCSVKMKEPKCAVAMTPPRAECQAQGNADCNANCQASGSARASCTPARVAIQFSGGVKADATAQARFNGLVRTLEVNLPNVAAVFSARINQLVTFGGKLSVQAGAIATGGGLSAKATGCGIQVVGAIEPAVKSLSATLEAAQSVSAVVKIGG